MVEKTVPEMTYEYPIQDILTAFLVLNGGRFLQRFETNIKRDPTGGYRITCLRLEGFFGELKEIRHIPLSTALFDHMHEAGYIGRGVYNPETGEIFLWHLTEMGQREASHLLRIEMEKWPERHRHHKSWNVASEEAIESGRAFREVWDEHIVAYQK